MPAGSCRRAWPNPGGDMFVLIRKRTADHATTLALAPHGAHDVGGIAAGYPVSVLSQSSSVERVLLVRTLLENVRAQPALPWRGRPQPASLDWARTDRSPSHTLKCGRPRWWHATCETDASRGTGGRARSLSLPSRTTALLLRSRVRRTPQRPRESGGATSCDRRHEAPAVA